MTIELVQKEDLPRFKADMQEAFQLGAVEGGYPIDDEPILPESHIACSLNAKGTIAYKAVLDDGMVGGAVVVIDPEKQSGHLDLLYVKHGIQSQGVGKFLWFAVEKRHPEVKVWETCTPYFEKRNIHFYINVCGFHATEFFNARHPDPNEPEGMEGEGDFEMFAFRKITTN